MYLYFNYLFSSPFLCLQWFVMMRYIYVVRYSFHVYSFLFIFPLCAVLFASDFKSMEKRELARGRTRFYFG